MNPSHSLISSGFIKHGFYQLFIVPHLSRRLTSFLPQLTLYDITISSTSVEITLTLLKSSSALHLPSGCWRKVCGSASWQFYFFYSLFHCKNKNKQKRTLMIPPTSTNLLASAANLPSLLSWWMSCLFPSKADPSSCAAFLHSAPSQSRCSIISSLPSPHR